MRAHANVAIHQRRALAAFSKGCKESSGFIILVLANGKLKEYKKDPRFVGFPIKPECEHQFFQLPARLHANSWMSSIYILGYFHLYGLD